MNDFIEEPTPVTRQLVPEDQRLAVTAELFGAHFQLAIEPAVFSITERMAEDYMATTGSFTPWTTAHQRKASIRHRKVTRATRWFATTTGRESYRETPWES